MRHTISLASILALALCLVGPPAAAAPITFDFTATVTSISELGVFTGMTGLSSGDTITGSYTFESTTTDTSASPNLGTYDGALTSVSIVLGLVTLDYDLTSASTNRVWALDDWNAGGLIDGHAPQIGGASGSTLGGQTLTAATFAIYLGTSNLGAVTSDAIWTSAPGADLSGFDRYLSMPISGSNASGSFSIAATPSAIVPEASTGALVGLGLLFVAGQRRPRRCA